MSCIHNYICQLPGKFDVAVEDFKKQDDWARIIGIVALTALAALATCFICFLGAIPGFIWAVKWLKADDVSASDQVGVQLGINQNNNYYAPRPINHELKATMEPMVNNLSSEVSEEDRQALAEMNFFTKDDWERADLTNGSELQKLVTLMKESTWNPGGNFIWGRPYLEDNTPDYGYIPENFTPRAFFEAFNEKYEEMDRERQRTGGKLLIEGHRCVNRSESIRHYIDSARSLNQLKAINAYMINFVNWKCPHTSSDKEYEDVSRLGWNFVGLARNGVLEAWFLKAKELSGVQQGSNIKRAR